VGGRTISNSDNTHALATTIVHRDLLDPPPHPDVASLATNESSNATMNDHAMTTTARRPPLTTMPQTTAPLAKARPVNRKRGEGW
jgi:hypothetical protein